jgi:hypothetical protein
MAAGLDSRDHVVNGQQLKPVNHRVVVPVLEYEGRNGTRDERHFSAREAVVPAPLEPLVRVVRLRRASACEDVLEGLGADLAGATRIERLPESSSEAIVAALPQGAGDDDRDRPLLDSVLHTAVPDSRVINSDTVVDPRMREGRACREQKNQPEIGSGRQDAETGRAQ